MNIHNLNCIGVLFCSLVAAMPVDDACPLDAAPEFQGKGYMPPQPFLLKLDEDDAKAGDSGLANWSLFENEPLRISKIRIIMCPQKKEQKGIECVSGDQKILSVVGESFYPGRIRRWGLSDFSHGRCGFFGGIEGVVLITHGEEDIVIGISEQGFSFGQARGNTHELFESWLLAKAVDDLLVQGSGMGLRPKLFAALSGELTLEQQRELYKTLYKP